MEFEEFNNGRKFTVDNMRPGQFASTLASGRKNLLFCTKHNQVVNLSSGAMWINQAGDGSYSSIEVKIYDSGESLLIHI